MADRLTLELATPTRMVVAETVDEVVVPGSQGYFGVLPGHAPLLATLGIGELTYRIGRDRHVSLVAADPIRQLTDAERRQKRGVPGSQGYFGVLPGHAPLLATLGIGELTYRIGRDERHVAVAGGFAEVRNDKVIVLADTAEVPQDIDRARAERAKERAEQRLAGRAQDEIDYMRAAAALARALTRLQVASRGR